MALPELSIVPGFVEPQYADQLPRRAVSVTDLKIIVGAGRMGFQLKCSEL